MIKSFYKKYQCGLRLLLVISLLQLHPQLWSQRLEPGAIRDTRNTLVHDPVILKQDSVFYIFATGNGIDVWSSTDLQTWKKGNPVFSNPPQWAVKAVPGFKGHIWAPDIYYFNSRYYLFYSVSQFGKNTSCIGVAVNRTLHPSSKDYQWEDLGMIIQSIPGRDLWNAIDPNLVVDEMGRPWLSFGSFWGGIKLVRMDSSMKVAEPQQWHTIARRPRNYQTADASGGGAAIEAPFIYKKDSLYYLFVSFDYCCQGPKSTYKMVVGRSNSVTGPYIDRAGTRMDQNGGTLIMEGNPEWYGVGHNAVFSEGGKYYLLFHGYDAKDGGRSKLRIEELAWDSEGWPIVKSQR
jgi:arabinan endo-1,5-alpha-L-arabinosidase